MLFHLLFQTWIKNYFILIIKMERTIIIDKSYLPRNISNAQAQSMAMNQEEMLPQFIIRQKNTVEGFERWDEVAGQRWFK